MSTGICHCERREAIQTAAAHRLRRHIGTPGVAARARRLRQRLAMFLGAVEPAKIGAFARSRAGDEEPRVALLRGRAAADEGEKGDGGGRGESACDENCFSDLCWIREGRSGARDIPCLLSRRKSEPGCHSRASGTPDDRMVARGFQIALRASGITP
jgi:hypothetical protein